MKSIRSCNQFRAAVLVGAIAILATPITTFAQSGEVLYGNSSIAPVYNYTTGGTVYILQPLNAPFPVKLNGQNGNSLSPVYAVAYPVQSTIPEASLQCLPTNCDHLNVLPFPDPYYRLASNAACLKFNGGSPCSMLKGHIHLFGVPSTGGEFNESHSVMLVIFTPQGFTDGAINTKVTTLSQMQALLDAGDAAAFPTPIVFHGSLVSEATYDRGAPVVISFP